MDEDESCGDITKEVRMGDESILIFKESCTIKKNKKARLPLWEELTIAMKAKNA